MEKGNFLTGVKLIKIKKNITRIFIFKVFDPEKNEWREIANLLTKRWKCGLVEHGGYLYAVGGMDSPKAGIWGAPLNTGIKIV